MSELDSRRISEVDRAGFLRDYEKWPARCEEALRAPVPQPPAEVAGVVVVGMGGSGVVGDIVTEWLYGKSQVPVVAVKEPTLPAFVTEGYLVIAVSYSGNTEETLLAAKEASDRGCTVVGVGTGGMLERLCLARKHEFVKVSEAVAPRSALPQMLFSVVKLLSTADVADGTPELKEATARIANLAEVLSVDEPVQTNPAKALALKLYGKFPLIYASRITRPAGIRFKASLNENAKARGIVEVLPELCHNEVVAWDAPPEAALCTLFLRSSGEPEYVERRFTALSSLVKGAGYEPIEVRGEGASYLTQILSLIYLLDYTSLYLAVLRGIDPLPTRAIDELKRVLYKRD